MPWDRCEWCILGFGSTRCIRYVFFFSSSFISFVLPIGNHTFINLSINLVQSFPFCLNLFVEYIFFFLFLQFQLSFKCSGSSHSPPSTLDSHVDPHTGVQLQEVTATISKDLVFEYFGKSPFKCDCHAWSPRGKAKSQSATIEVACKWSSCLFFFLLYTEFMFMQYLALLPIIFSVDALFQWRWFDVFAHKITCGHGLLCGMCFVWH